MWVCRPVPPPQIHTPPTHPPFPTPIFRHMILHYYVKSSHRLSSPSAADRTIIEHSLELFLIHASCDKGTCFPPPPLTGGGLLFQMRSQACNLRFPHNGPLFLESSCLYVVDMQQVPLPLSMLFFFLCVCLHGVTLCLLMCSKVTSFFFCVCVWGGLF